MAPDDGGAGVYPPTRFPAGIRTADRGEASDHSMSRKDVICPDRCAPGTDRTTAKPASRWDPAGTESSNGRASDHVNKFSVGIGPPYCMREETEQSTSDHRAASSALAATKTDLK
ncbi:hypothetical protein F1880_002698 [Penicillium rolfsii]|nr:hypothetical protein F1880_002698 [Penicillium rolfsii]